MSRPKPDQRLIDAIKRMRNGGELNLVIKHLQDLLQHRKDLLVTTSPTEIPTIQGRCLELQDILDLFAKDKP